MYPLATAVNQLVRLALQGCFPLENAILISPNKQVISLLLAIHEVYVVFSHPSISFRGISCTCFRSFANLLLTGRNI